MNPENGTDHPARLMRQLIEELRAEPPPELDWSRVERRLAANIAKETNHRAAHAAWWHHEALRHVATFAVAAAVLALFIVTQGRSGPELAAGPSVGEAVEVSSLPTTSSTDGPTTYRVDAIAAGSVIESDESPIRFSLPGVAQWTLGPRGRIVLRTVQKPLVVELEKGTVQADVVPRSTSPIVEESFAVIAGNTRIAVHGTVFSVSRQREHVTVGVTRGTVVVGPAGHHGLTTGHLLVAPARAAFSLDGGRRAQLLRPPEPAEQIVASADLLPALDRAEPTVLGPAPIDDPVAETKPARATDHAAAATERAVAAAAPPTDPPVEPTGTEPDTASETADAILGIAEARNLLVSCLAARSGDAPAPSDQDVTKVISSIVRLSFDAEGRVSTVMFRPPLRPDLQQRCASLLFGRRVSAGGSSVVQFHVSARTR